MRGLIVKDWSRVNFRDREHVRMLMGAVQHFLAAPETDPKFKAALRAFTTKGDFPAELMPLIEKYRSLPTWDTAYEDIFDIRDFTNTKANGFEILDVTNGLTFEEVKVGEKAKLHQFSGAKAQVTFAMYGAGLNWHRTLIDDAQYWALEDNTIAMQSAYYTKKAETHYTLIEGISSGQDVSWQNPDPSGLPNTDALYTANRDAQTINKACELIISDLKNKGLGVGVNSQFILLAPHTLRKRIQKAMDYMAQQVAGSVKEMVYNVSPRYTAMLSSAADYYVCIPKGKLKGGNRMNLTLMYNEDILAYADTVAGWGRWGAAIGEVKQIRRCKTA